MRQQSSAINLGVLVIFSICLTTLGFNNHAAGFVALPRPVTRSKLSVSSLQSHMDQCPRRVSMVAGAPEKPKVVIPDSFPSSMQDKASLFQPTLQSIPSIFSSMATKYPNNVALVDESHGDRVELTYSQLYDNIKTLSGGLQKLGVQQGDKVCIFSENSNRWLQIEQAVMALGGVNAVRGAATPVDELAYIYENSQSSAVVVEDESILQKVTQGDGLSSVHGPPKLIVVLFSGGRTGEQLTADAGGGVQVITFEELISMDATPELPSNIQPDDLATLVYTSGTTGRPKGVMLAHSNLLHQVELNSFNPQGDGFDPEVGDVAISILPCWHIFERAVEYYFLSKGMKLVYSSIRTFKSDLKKWQPHFLVAVPRLLEVVYTGVMTNFASQPASKQKLVSFFTRVSMQYVKARRVRTGLLLGQAAPGKLSKIKALAKMVAITPLVRVADKLVWSKVRAGLGGRLKVLVVGGSLLALHLEDFYDMIGERVIVGYGLTETSPVICSRRTEHNVVGSVGVPASYTQVKVVDPADGREVTLGNSGVVMAKGPQVMQGYYQQPEETAKVFDQEGFFNTGDLGYINTITGDLVLSGRVKDTIVLSNGENVEPANLEDAIVQHPLIDQAFLVGQDQRFLGAMVVVRPEELEKSGLVAAGEGERLRKLVEEGDAAALAEAAANLQATDTVRRAVMAAVKEQTSTATARAWEKVQTVSLLLEPFSTANQLLTPTLKVKRNVVTARYQEQIASMYK